MSRIVGRGPLERGPTAGMNQACTGYPAASVIEKVCGVESSARERYAALSEVTARLRPLRRSSTQTSAGCKKSAQVYAIVLPSALIVQSATSPVPLVSLVTDPECASIAMSVLPPGVEMSVTIARSPGVKSGPQTAPGILRSASTQSPH